MRGPGLTFDKRQRAGNIARRLVELARDETIPPKARDGFRGLADAVLRAGAEGLSPAHRERLAGALEWMRKITQIEEVKS